jgi:hypothetical protein
MIRLTENRLFRVLTAAFTVLAVMIGFCFAALEPPQAAGFEIGGTGGLIEEADNFIPSPAEAPALLTKTSDTQFVPLRTGFQRIFIPCGTHGAASAFYQLRFRTNSHVCYINVKNITLLKLLI